MADPVLVGLDAGTNRVKAVLVDLAGHELATASATTPWVVEGANVEMDASTLADIGREVIRKKAFCGSWPGHLNKTAEAWKERSRASAVPVAGHELRSCPIAGRPPIRHSPPQHYRASV